MLSALRHGGVYPPDPGSRGVLPGSTFPRGWRNINRLPIGYASRPRLRSRLTLGGLTFPRKPCAFGGGASHPPCRYSFPHSPFPPLPPSSPSRFAAAGHALPPSKIFAPPLRHRPLSPS